ncbi:DUF4192 domain-containing protein [Jiangella rhizosphaerae]|uniref:DUF4192 domain-containing protein n=1 Tax=Jiangella rhizosphaerae TaxID=2293569 RepID=A0A418KW20_9ACTN|nr:DUF4192 domain-containing protein [Jiangella rhizosphaerae]RIQ34134.1 DUF4192 domain-containing protein [Jiangella rhizosphaerae]
MKIREHHKGTATAGDPGELLAAIPHLMGFHPQSSIVVVHVDLEDRRTGTLLRLDLPGAGDDEGYARQLAKRIEYGQPDGVILVCYGDREAPPGAGGAPPGAGGAPPGHPSDRAASSRRGVPHQALIELIVGELAGGPVKVLGTAYVDGGRWWTYDCDHPGCCPADGVPLPDPGMGAAADVAARAALAGRRTLSSRRELEDSLRGLSGADEKAMAGVFERVDRELAAEALADGVEVVRGRTLALARLLLARSAEGRLELADDDVARLSLGAADLLVRDRFIALDGADPAAWLGLLTALARRTPDARAAAVCSVVAWVAYQQGDGAVANVALDRVLSVDPRHTMALLLRDCLDSQVSPGHIAALTREAVDAAERARREVSAAGAA